MALITQFAQPGMYVAQGLAGIRENRLAMAAAEAEQATARSQQEIRQRAFQSLGAEGSNPQAAIGALAAAGDLDGARLASTMITAQAQAATAEERRRNTLIQRRDELLENFAQIPDPTPEQLRGFQTRWESSGIGQVTPFEEAQALLPAFRQGPEIELIRPGDPDYPETARPGTLFQRHRNGRITPIGGTGETEMGAVARSIGGLAAGIATGVAQETPGARDAATRSVSEAIESVGTTLRTAQTIAQGNPGAFGARGNVARDVGAGFEQLFGAGAANTAARFISGGAGLNELARIRAATQIQVAQSIPDFTGEESGRITEAEREITNQAVGATNALSNQSGAMEALAYVYPLQLSRVNRQKLLSRGVLEYRFIMPNGEVDLDVLDQHLGAPMRTAGFTDEQIQRAARDTVMITRQQAAMLAGGAFIDE